MTDLANLKALCVAAGVEEWEVHHRHDHEVWPKGPSFNAIATVQVSNNDIWPEQAAFIAAANPAVVLDLIERVERAEGRCAWMDTAAKVLAGYERDLGESLDDMHELGRIDESRDCPSFRIRVGHIRPSAPPPPISEGSE